MPMIIDIHGHLAPPGAHLPALSDVEGMIEQKARAGIALTIIGNPSGAGSMLKAPGVPFTERTPDQIKAFHEWLVETVAKHPGRLKAYAYANPFAEDKVLQDTARTVKDGGFVGLIINTSVRGEYLDAERSEPFFAMAAELGVPIFLHPPVEPVGGDS